MNWKINENSFRCVHKSGAIVYFDPNLSSSGAMKCVGPFQALNMKPDYVRLIMKELTESLEKLFFYDDVYVLWGAYEDAPQYHDHEIVIHGSVCGHIPSVSMRAKILGPENTKEWKVVGHEYVHLSGLTSRTTCADDMDTSVFHPLTVASEVNALFFQLQNERLGGPVHFAATPLLRWSGCNRQFGNQSTPQRQRESRLVHPARRVQ